MTLSMSTIQVYSGGLIDPINPNPEDINITDVAHSLAYMCRFAGHTKVFYSVAEHSIRVSELVPDDDKLWGLLHDASEAYLVDIPSPLKNDLFGARYRDVELRLMDVIIKKYGLPSEMPASVKKADNVMLATEVRDLLNKTTSDELWEPWLQYPAMEAITLPMSPAEAEEIFLETFDTLSYTGRLENADNR